MEHYRRGQQWLGTDCGGLGRFLPGLHEVREHYLVMSSNIWKLGVELQGHALAFG